MSAKTFDPRFYFFKFGLNWNHLCKRLYDSFLKFSSLTINLGWKSSIFLFWNISSHFKAVKWSNRLWTDIVYGFWYLWSHFTTIQNGHFQHSIGDKVYNFQCFLAILKASKVAKWLEWWSLKNLQYLFKIFTTTLQLLSLDSSRLR